MKLYFEFTFLCCALWLLPSSGFAIESENTVPLANRFTQQYPVQSVSLSPDGQRIAVLAESDKSLSELWIADTTHFDWRKIYTNKAQTELAWDADSASAFLLSKQRISTIPLIDKGRPRILAQLGKRDSYVVNQSQLYAEPIISRRDASDVYTLSGYSPAKEVNDALGKFSHQISAFIASESEHGSFTISKQWFKESTALIANFSNGQETLMQCSRSELEDPCELLGYNPATNSLYLRGRFGANLVGLYSYNLMTRSLSLIQQDPLSTADLEHVVMNDQGMPQFTYYRGQMNYWYALDPLAEKALSAVPINLMNTLRKIECSIDTSTCLFTSESPLQLSRQYWLWRDGGETLTQVSLKPVMSDKSFSRTSVQAKVEALHYKVSDGMSQYGYLYLPLNKAPEDSPLVVYPHGGPHSRDYFQSNRLALYLVSRGYAVLKPNFRGSTGFGLDYMQSSENDFGNGRVLNDILDAANFVRKQGVGTNRKMAIVGESFGGFSAISAATFSEDFSVAVAAMPALEIGSIRASLVKRQIQPDRINALAFLWGDLDDKHFRQRLAEKSPLEHANKLVTPLFIWAGALDPIVPISHVKEYALRQHTNNKSIALMVDSRSGHGPSSQKSLLAYMTMTEMALAYYVGDTVSELPDGELLDLFEAGVKFNSTQVDLLQTD